MPAQLRSIRPPGLIPTLLLTSVVTIVLSPRLRSSLRALFHHLLHPSTRSRRPILGPGSFASLRHAILGTSKQSISEVFGPPPTASLATASAPSIYPGYLAADTWYYPLDPTDRSGMAIRFSNNVALKIDLIKMPRGRRVF